MTSTQRVSLPCPACGFETVCESTYGTYGICPLCDWEEDPVQLANPCTGGGANRKSLAEAQHAALKKYPIGVEIAQGYKRDKRWRALESKEIEIIRSGLTTNVWPNKAILDETCAYWCDSHNSTLHTDATRR
jgi:hypothetical protein